MKSIFVASAAKFERMKFEVQYIIYLLRVFRASRPMVDVI